MEPDEGRISTIMGVSNQAESCRNNCTSVQIISRKRRRENYSDSIISQHQCHRMTLSFYPLVLLASLLLMCLIPLPAHCLPFDGSLISGSSSSNYRSQVDLLIDPIIQAENEEDGLESKRVVAKSVFDMVLRTPPPPTSSTRCPLGTQSPFEGGPCIKKSTGPVALLDQSFILDDLRGLAKEGFLFSGGSKKRTGSGGSRKRNGSRFTSTTTSTTPQPTTTVPSTTEGPVPETTFTTPGDSPDSTEVVTQGPGVTPLDISSASGNSPNEEVRKPFSSGGEEIVFPLDNTSPGKDVTFDTTPITFPDDSRFEDLITTTRTENTQLNENRGNSDDEQAITITTTAPTTITAAPQSLSQSSHVEEKSGQVRDRHNQESELVLISLPKEDDVREGTTASGSEFAPENGQNFSEPQLDSDNGEETGIPVPSTTTNVIATEVPTTFSSLELSSSSDKNVLQPSPPIIVPISNQTANPIGTTSLTDITDKESSLSSGEDVFNQDVRFLHPSRQLDQGGGDNLEITRMMAVTGEEQPQIQDLTQLFDNSGQDKINSDKDTPTYISITTTSPILSEREEPSAELDGVLFLNTKGSPLLVTSTDTSEQEPSSQSFDESNNAGSTEEGPVIITKEAEQHDGVSVQQPMDGKQMMTTGDMNMTAAQPLPSFSLDEEQSRVVVVGDEDPSSTLVNHLVVSEMTNKTDDDEDETVVVDGDRDGGDLLSINDPTVSPVQPNSQTRNQQVIVNKDGEISSEETSSSSRDSIRKQEELEQPVYSEEGMTPEFSTIIPPTIPATVSRSPFQPKDTLLQFQLPIVTRGPIRHGDSFQTFPEFPSSVRGRIRFPNELPPVEQNGPVKINFRGTVRPVFVEDFQIDYPPPHKVHHSQQPPVEERSFTPVKEAKWETAKPFLAPVDTSPTTQTSPSEYGTGSTEFLESELDRRHQKTRSRNRSRESTTNQSLPPEFTFYSPSQYPPLPPEVQQPSPSSASEQQPFYFARRSPASDLVPFGYLNFGSGQDNRFNNNRRRLIW